MASKLTPAALKELELLLWNSRRKISEFYRLHSAGLSLDELARLQGHRDLKEVKNTLSTLRILFGRAPLPKTGNGRQKAINEAEQFLKGDAILSTELREHFEFILLKGEKTNTRRKDLYEPPTPPPVPYSTQVRRKAMEGRQSGVYVITKKDLLDEHAESVGPLVVKIGWSTDVWDRIAGAQTWDHEELAVLRVFFCDNANTTEAKFHIVLDTLGLSYGSGGKEWFIVKPSLIDEIAESLGLINYEEEV